MTKKQQCKKFVLHATLCIVVFGVCGVGVQDVDAKTLKAKTYKDDYTIDDGEVLEGAGPGKTTIKGNIRVRDHGTLRNLTVKSGGISVLSGASLTIENVVVDDAPATAIETRGGGTLIVRNSQIINSGGKAFYIQAGKHFVLTGSVVRGAGEEGVDIRDGASGVISGNTIVNNKESGIEIILGNASMKITNNVINNNGSSGIAAQYHTLAKSTGNVSITNNQLIGNSNYGLDCKIPSGGHPGDGYWNASTTFVDNTISGNGLGNIAPRCGVYNVDSEAVRLAREKAEEEARLKAEEEARQKAEAERRAREIEEQKRVLTESEELLHTQIAQIKEHKAVIDAQWWVQAFFIGADKAQIDALRAQRDAIAQVAQSIDALTQQQLDDAERVRVDVLKGRLGVIKEPLEAYVAEKEKSGLWHRVTNILQ